VTNEVHRREDCQHLIAQKSVREAGGIANEASMGRRIRHKIAALPAAGCDDSAIALPGGGFGRFRTNACKHPGILAIRKRTPLAKDPRLRAPADKRSS
jgi:hypothetical protein